MPYTEKQRAFFRVAMHDMKRSKKERDEYRRMYNEGVSHGGSGKTKRKPKSSSRR